MTAPAPVPDGTTPPAEAAEAAMEALGCSATATAWADREETRRVVVCAAHRDEWIAQGCPVAISVAAAVVAALDLPGRDREAGAKALDEAVEACAITIPDVLGYKVQAVAVEDMDARAAALREGRADG